MESGERVIDLLALIRTVLKKWRRMLIFGILFALLSLDTWQKVLFRVTGYQKVGILLVCSELV